jgi:Crp-like helix-turn-helix domain
VSLVVAMRDGTAIETMMLGRAGVVGCAAAWGGRHCIGRAIVRLPGSASRLSAAEFRAAARASDAIYQLALRYNDLLLGQMQQAAACYALHGLEARLCRWLLQAHDSAEGNVLPITQHLLSQVLGARRTSVTLVARALQSAGIIKYRRGRIEIIDRGKLKAASCECYASMRQCSDGTFPLGPGMEPHLGKVIEIPLDNFVNPAVHNRDGSPSTTR